MLAAEALAGSGQPKLATRFLERAAALVPVATGKTGPRARLAALALGQGDTARAMAALEAAIADDLTSLDEARQLAALAAEAGDAHRSLLAHTRISELVPYEWASHTAIGRAAMARGDLAVAAQRFRLALAAGPDDPAGARTDHAELLVIAGKRDDAKRELLSALTDAPLYERAQELLLKVVGDDRTGGRRP
jgi:tetratricopeptide (TPR) repeat protein